MMDKTSTLTSIQGNQSMHNSPPNTRSQIYRVPQGQSSIENGAHDTEKRLLKIQVSEDFAQLSESNNIFQCKITADQLSTFDADTMQLVYAYWSTKQDHMQFNRDRQALKMVHKTPKSFC